MESTEPRISAALDELSDRGGVAGGGAAAGAWRSPGHRQRSRPPEQGDRGHSAHERRAVLAATSWSARRHTPPDGPPSDPEHTTAPPPNRSAMNRGDSGVLSSRLASAEPDHGRPGLARTLPGHTPRLEFVRQLTDQRPLPGLGREHQSSAQRRLDHASKIQVTGAVRRERRPRTVACRIVFRIVQGHHGSRT